MAKKRNADSSSSSTSSVKKPAGKELQMPSILQTLLGANKATLDIAPSKPIKNKGKEESPEKPSSGKDNIYNSLRAAQSKFNNPVSKDLLNFITAQLVKQPEFKGVNFADIPERDSEGNRMDSYDTRTKSIKLSPVGFGTNAGPTINPFLTLVHEGTHALDHLNMKTYQHALDFLINKKIPFNNEDWYKGAQSILPQRDFKELYPYKFTNKEDQEGGAQADINNSFWNLQSDLNTKKMINPLGNFKDLHPLFEKVHTGQAHNKERELPKDYFFTSLSEFPAFAVEGLSSPWNIKEHAKNFPTTQNEKKNLPRKFLKTMLKDVWQNFNTMEPEFADKYPAANKGFIDRLVQLRNQSKKEYQGQEGMKEYEEYLNTQFSRLNE